MMKKIWKCWLKYPLLIGVLLLVGCAAGAIWTMPVIAQVAAEFPQLVDGAVFVAGPAGPEHVRRTWYQSLAATDLGQAVISRDLKTAHAEMLALESELEVLEPAWAHMDFPITVIHARNDSLAKFANVAFLQERIQPECFTLRELKTGNHFLIWSHKKMVVDEIRTIIKNQL